MGVRCLNPPLDQIAIRPNFKAWFFRGSTVSINSSAHPLRSASEEGLGSLSDSCLLVLPENGHPVLKENEQDFCKYMKRKEKRRRKKTFYDIFQVSLLGFLRAI